VDPVVATSAAITALHSIVSRDVPPGDAAVLSVTTVRGGTVARIRQARSDFDLGFQVQVARTFIQVVKTFIEVVKTCLQVVGTLKGVPSSL
jgi:metal-dependent amidase/aminoacylase/carboxypeptidase family protein